MIPQTSSSWLPARIGNLTASDMGDVVARNLVRFKKPVFKKGVMVPGSDQIPMKGSGEYTAARGALRNKLAAERYLDGALDNYIGQAGRDGIEREPAMKQLFQVKSGILLRPAGLIMHPTIEHFGATPDGLIGGDAVFEGKCPTEGTYFEWIREGVVPAQHKPQILAQLACTGRRTAYFAAYFPAKDPARRLFWRKWTPERAEIEAIESEAVAFLKEVEAVFQWAVMHCQLPDPTHPAPTTLQ